MTVSNGQLANQTTFNDAFMSRTADDNTTGIKSLENTDTASGPFATNVQRDINSLSTYTGRTANDDKDALPVWSSTDAGTNTDDLTERAEALTAKFNLSTGHAHDGSAGGGQKIAVTDLTGYRAGLQSISASSDTVTVTFSSPLATATYGLGISIKNTVDTMPIFLQWNITAQSTTGFSLTFNAPTDSANYVVSYTALEAL